MKINPAFLFERVGHQVVVLDSTTQTVIAVSDDSARVLSDLRNGVEVSSDAPGMAELIDQGIVLSASTSQLSRRSLFVAGGAVGAGSVLALGLPAAAVASSLTPTKPPQPELENGEWDGNNNGGIPRLGRILGLEIQNFSAYGDSEPTFFWGYTADGPTFEFVRDGSTLEWDRGEDPQVEGPSNALDGEALTVLVFASVGGVLSDPTPHVLDRFES